MVAGSMSCVKYLMFVFNFIFVVCGIILIAIGAVVYNDDVTHFADTKFATGPTILIVVGCIIFLLAFLGCCGAVKENRCMVTLFGLLLFVIFVIEIAGGITAYVHRDKFQVFVKQAMNESIKQDSKSSKKFWSDLQIETKCCGVDGPMDYVYNNKTVPPSCCPQHLEACDETHAFKLGCYAEVLRILKSKLTLVGGVAVGIAFVELVGCMFAWCLASAIKKEYEGV